MISSRAHYGRLKPVLFAIRRHPAVHLQIVLGASAILRNYGQLESVLADDGLPADAVFHTVVEGENHIAMAKTSGLIILELSTLFDQLRPDIVLLHADRYEVLPAAIAATYLNIMVAHNQGGEVSGSIDESVRHAITKLAHLHFAATSEAARRIIKLGENSSMVWTVGCPSIDLIKQTDLRITEDVEDRIHETGVGQIIDLRKPYIVVVYHPVTTDSHEVGKERAMVLLRLIHALGIQAIWFWPNVDAGSDAISKAIRSFREQHDSSIQFVRNVSPEDYLCLINHAQCCIGNSSSFIREGAFLGVPVVNIGGRQAGRQYAENVINTDFSEDQLMGAIRKQLNHERYPASTLYGEGHAGERIADILATCSINIRKHLAY